MIVPWIEVQLIQSRRRENGQRPLTNAECLALESSLSKRYKRSNPSGDEKMADAIDPIAVPDVPPQDNLRFRAEDAISFTDLLTNRTYRVMAVGDTQPSSPELAANHLVKVAAKTVLSLNKAHQNDYFWGEISVAARKALKDQGITNMPDLLGKIDQLGDVPSKLLVEVIKMLIALKQA
jgi:hypothetical protein